LPADVHGTGLMLCASSSLIKAPLLLLVLVLLSLQGLLM